MTMLRQVFEVWAGVTMYVSGNAVQALQCLHNGQPSSFQNLPCVVAVSDMLCFITSKHEWCCVHDCLDGLFVLDKHVLLKFDARNSHWRQCVMRRIPDHSVRGVL